MSAIKVTFEPFAVDNNKATIGPLLLEQMEQPDVIELTSWGPELRPGDYMSLRLKIAKIEPIEQSAKPPTPTS